MKAKKDQLEIEKTIAPSTAKKKVLEYEQGKNESNTHFASVP